MSDVRTHDGVPVAPEAQNQPKMRMEFSISAKQKALLEGKKPANISRQTWSNWLKQQELLRVSKLTGIYRSWEVLLSGEATLRFHDETLC